MSPNPIPTAGIVLAAGQSKRLGRPKQLIRIGSEFSLERVLNVTLASRLEKVILVLGHARDEIIAALGTVVQNPKLEIITNSRYAHGMAGSLRVGLMAVQARYPAVMVILGDQPLLDTPTINRLLDRFSRSTKTICAPVCQGRRGLPVCFADLHYPRILELTGDIGARNIIRNNPEQVILVEIENTALFQDLDTQADIDKLSAYLQPYPINHPNRN